MKRLFILALLCALVASLTSCSNVYRAKTSAGVTLTLRSYADAPLYEGDIVKALPTDDEYVLSNANTWTLEQVVVVN